MARYYGHRITKREREVVHRLYAPRIPRAGNQQDAFSHSEQCNAFLSTPVVTNPGTGRLVSGFEGAHTGCRCWCHNAQSLFASAEPEYDTTPPPEYLNSADLAFIEASGAFEGMSAGSSGSDVDGPHPVYSEPEIFDNFDTPFGECPEVTGDINYLTEHLGERETHAQQFSNRSRQELARGKCDTCGDSLKDCECVE